MIVSDAPQTTIWTLTPSHPAPHHPIPKVLPFSISQPTLSISSCFRLWMGKSPTYLVSLIIQYFLIQMFIIQFFYNNMLTFTWIREPALSDYFPIFLNWCSGISQNFNTGMYLCLILIKTYSIDARMKCHDRHISALPYESNWITLSNNTFSLYYQSYILIEKWEQLENLLYLTPYLFCPLPFLSFSLSSLSLPPRHHSAHEWKQAHCRVPQGAFLQGVGILWRASAVATGDRAADGEDPGWQVWASAWRGDACCTHCREQVSQWSSRMTCST